jgi:signal transduction histidine kinase
MEALVALAPQSICDEEFQTLLAERLPDLAQKLARLAELESEFAAALEREKLAALKELAYGASHEINNPLANISTRAQALLRDETDPERRRKLATINSQAFRAHEMIADMMLFAKPPKLVREPVDVVQLVDTVLAELAPEARSQGTQLSRVSASETLTLSLDVAQIGVAVKALLTNALEALGSGGRVEVSVRALHGPSSAEIVVSDNGPGISPEVRRHLFDPFYSGREAGRGLGFGLAKCWRIVTDHGGRIEVDSEPGKGARFTVSLPD